MNIKVFGVAALLVIIMLSFLFFGIYKKNTQPQVEYTCVVQEEEIEIAEEIPVVIEDTVVVVETLLRGGEGPFNVMERLNIDRRLRQRIIDNLANETDFTALRAGERFAGIFDLDTTKLLEFVYFQNPITTHRVRITYDENGDLESIEYVLEERPSETRHRLLSGTLNSPTLDAELRSMGLSSNLVGVATNVLASRVAFRTDARIGDNFSLLLKEIYFTDTLDNGEIVERTLDERTQVLRLFYSGVRAGRHIGYRFFDAPNSSYNAHYGEDGRAMIFAGLRYPLDRIHITSPFGMRRHPVTGVRAMHWGVDYRARIGTPVFAVAEGRVVKSRQDNLNGNYIAIRHVDGTTSYYLHLSRRMVSVGAQVRARQQIGLSGATGMVTGPHLCFRIRDPRGQWINPSNKRMIATPQLTGEKLEDLRAQISEIREIYERERKEFAIRLAETKDKL
ncbi:MAG: M23 family metallopeptidase [Chitinivibrionia bacterium]|nr:M23 family metallopeptidase [Chitinivibrionia bacterium]